MSQAVIYKTKFKSLKDMYKHIQKLIKDGVFLGAGAEVLTKNDPGFESAKGRFYTDRNKIVMVVNGNNEGKKNIFTGTEGFVYGQSGFAVTWDEATKEINIVIETRYKEATDPEVVALKERIRRHIDSGTKFDKVYKLLQEKAKDVQVTRKPDGGWKIIGDLPPEVLQGIQEIQAGD